MKITWWCARARLNQLLLIDGILDITDVKLNGASENVTLDEDAIPVRGDVSG